MRYKLFLLIALFIFTVVHIGYGQTKSEPPGTYKTAGTVYIGSNTSLIFGNNIFLKKK